MQGEAPDLEEGELEDGELDDDEPIVPKQETEVPMQQTKPALPVGMLGILVIYCPIIFQNWL